MPKLDQMRRKFRDSIEFILVGNDDKYIQPMYERIRKHFNLEIPVVFDSTIFKKFGIATVPHIIWIDQKGIVKAITSTLTEEALQNFITDKPISLIQSSNIDQYFENKLLYDYDSPLLLKNNGGYDSAFLYRSVFAKWQPQTDVFYSTEVINSKNGNKIQVIGQPLYVLYKLAYGDTAVFDRPPGADEGRNSYGFWWPKPTLEFKDTSEFYFDERNRTNLYTYSTVIPPNKSGPLILKKIMQNDLNNYFPYVVFIEIRSKPYWSLTLLSPKSKAKLKAKGARPSIEFKEKLAGFKFVNQPVSQIISILFAYNQGEPPFLDETGLNHKLDIEIDAILTDFADIKAALKDKGLLLEKKYKKMKVIVIKDSKANFINN